MKSSVLRGDQKNVSFRTNSQAPVRMLPVGHRWLTTAALLLCGLLAVPRIAQVARAASVIPLDLAQLTERAELIVVAQVGPQQARRTERGLIVTDVEVNPDEVVKGEAAVGAPLLVTHLGGVIGDIGLHVPGEVTFGEGEQALLFLRRSQENDLRVVGMSQGKLQITTARGQRYVRIPRVLRMSQGHADGNPAEPATHDTLRATPGEDSKDGRTESTSVDVELQLDASQPLSALLREVRRLL